MLCMYSCWCHKFKESRKWRPDHREGKKGPDLFDEEEVQQEFDKFRCVGPVKDGQQTTIVGFKSHKFKEEVYKKEKQQKTKQKNQTFTNKN